jgi:hypothetical protein
MKFKFNPRKEENRMPPEDRNRQNAPEMAGNAGKNEGGKVENKKTEGGTSPSPLEDNAEGRQPDPDITKGGTLTGERSLRPANTVEQQFAAINATAGPNPTPLREGNEITKAMEGRKFDDLAVFVKGLSGIALRLQKVVDDKHISKESRDIVIEVQNQLESAPK